MRIEGALDLAGGARQSFELSSNDLTTEDY